MIKYTPESSLLSSSGVTDVGIDPWNYGYQSPTESRGYTGKQEVDWIQIRYHRQESVYYIHKAMSCNEENKMSNRSLKIYESESNSWKGPPVICLHESYQIDCKTVTVQLTYFNWWTGNIWWMSCFKLFKTRTLFLSCEFDVHC
jgi:hypothetical protein